jgi:dynein heavy chain
LSRQDELLDECEMYPFNDDEKGVSFMSPGPTSYDNCLQHIDTGMTQDTPIAFGLHPNAEIDFRTTQSENMFRTIQELQPRDASSGEGALTPQQVAEALCIDITDKLAEKGFDIEDLVRTLEQDLGPYQNVFLQEMDVMNVLMVEMRRSLKDLSLGATFV